MPAHLRRRFVVAAGIAVAICALGWLGMTLGVGDSARADVLDSFAGTADADPRVMVVVADEEFIERGKSNPFLYAEVTELVDEGAAAAIVSDGSTLDAANPGLDDVAYDEIAAGVLGPIEGLIVGATEVKLDPPREGSSLPVLRSRRMSSIIADAVDAVGIGSVVLSGDESAMRTVPLVVETAPEEGSESAGALVPTIAVLALAQAEGLPLTVEEQDGAIKVGDRVIPTEDDQRLRIVYASELSHGGSQVITGSDVIDGVVAPSEFEGQVVLWGVTDPQLARIVPTPIGESGRLPEVLVEANVINTLLTEQYVRPLPESATVLLIGLLAFLVAFATLILPIWLTPLVPIVAGVAYWTVAERAYQSGRAVDVAYPLAAIVAAFAAGIIGRVGVELAHRRRVSSMFSRYVPPEVARQLMEEGEAEAAAAGQRLDVTVVFCDIRGFTPYCAKVEPAQVRAMLDEFYEISSRVILKRGGTVMQFVGDEVIAVFGAPIPDDNHVDAAIGCAIDWHAAKAELDNALFKLDLEPVEYGIGVHTGDVVAAHVGSSHRRQYTVLGETVNIGARLCSQAEAGETVISDATFEAATGPLTFEPMGRLELKGVTAPIDGYRCSAVKSQTAVTAP